MDLSPSRRAFLRGKVSPKPVQRPLGALAEMAFQDACSKCGDCVKACDESIITLDSEGFPTLDFTNSGCTFCGACTQACETGALSAENAWPWTAQISSNCLSISGVQCRVCQDQCEASAIRFQLRPGGFAVPMLDQDGCTGCGFCLGSCPSASISLIQSTPRSEARQ